MAWVNDMTGSASSADGASAVCIWRHRFAKETTKLPSWEPSRAAEGSDHLASRTRRARWCPVEDTIEHAGSGESGQ